MPLSLTEILRHSEICWHGVNAAQPDFSPHSHAIAMSALSSETRLALYVLFNAYWGPLTFNLPSPPKGSRRLLAPDPGYRPALARGHQHLRHAAGGADPGSTWPSRAAAASSSAAPTTSTRGRKPGAATASKKPTPATGVGFFMTPVCQASWCSTLVAAKLGDDEAAQGGGDHHRRRLLLAIERTEPEQQGRSQQGSLGQHAGDQRIEAGAAPLPAHQHRQPEQAPRMAATSPASGSRVLNACRR